MSVHAKSLQSYSLPGSSVHGILQAGILVWVAMPSSRIVPGLSLRLLCLLHWQVGSLPLIHTVISFSLPILYIDRVVKAGISLPILCM